jgi:hypothetical protein
MSVEEALTESLAEDGKDWWSGLSAKFVGPKVERAADRTRIAVDVCNGSGNGREGRNARSNCCASNR